MPSDVDELRARLEKLERKAEAHESGSDEDHPFAAIRSLHSRLRKVEKSLLAHMDDPDRVAPSPQSFEDPDEYSAPSVTYLGISPDAGHNS